MPRKSEREKAFRRKKVQAIVQKKTCQHTERTSVGQGKLKCTSCGIVINMVAQGIFGEQLVSAKKKWEKIKLNG